MPIATFISITEQNWSSTPAVGDIIFFDWIVDSQPNPQHVGVLNAWGGAILRGEPLVADGREGINGLMISNGLVALSGALLAQYQSFADINMGRGAIVIGLAAVIIGEVLFSKIFRNFALKLLSVSLGAIIYYIVIQAVISLLDINSNYMKLISAVIVAIFLAVPYLRHSFRGKRSKPAKAGKDKTNA